MESAESKHPVPGDELLTPKLKDVPNTEGSGANVGMDVSAKYPTGPPLKSTLALMECVPNPLQMGLPLADTRVSMLTTELPPETSILLVVKLGNTNIWESKRTVVLVIAPEYRLNPGPEA
jgi:hypothetical protein